MDKRKALLRLIDGQSLDDYIHFSITYSVLMTGEVVVWSGYEFTADDAIPLLDDPSLRVNRYRVLTEERVHLHPLTMWIAQAEKNQPDPTDDELIEVFREFRKQHPTDGFGFRVSLNRDDGCTLQEERTDKADVENRIRTQNRKIVREQFDVDLPFDVNSDKEYNRRVMADQGQASEWMREECRRIGVDYDSFHRRS